MNRPKQQLIDECDSTVIDYIAELEADRDNWKFTYFALERKYNELMAEWNTIEGIK